MKFEHLSKKTPQNKIIYSKKTPRLFSFEIKILSYMGFNIGEELLLKSTSVAQTIDNEKTNLETNKINFFKNFILFSIFFFIILIFFYFNIFILQESQISIFDVIFNLNEQSFNMPTFRKFYTINLSFNSIMLDFFKKFF